MAEKDPERVLKPTLMKKIREEEEYEKEQQALREKYNLEEAVEVRERGFKEHFLGFMKIFVTLVASVLAFVFLVVMIYPKTRLEFIGMLPFFGGGSL